MRLFKLAWLCTLLIGCAEYDVTVNDRLVYGPGQLLREFEVADSSLDACIRQGIADQRVTTAEELRILNCSHAGISSLEGIGQFNGLRQLKLSGNNIRNLVELSRISTLETLWLDENTIVDPIPLARLSSLKLLDLSANGGLQCPPGSMFGEIESLTLPSHCEST